MPLTSSWVQVPVTGLYSDRAGNPLSGEVDLISQATLVDGVFVAGTTFTLPVTNGVLAGTVPVAAAAATQAFTVVERVPGGRAAASVVVPNDPVNGVDLTATNGTAPVVVYPPALVSTVAATAQTIGAVVTS